MDSTFDAFSGGVPEGGMMAPQNVFDHCVETPLSMKMKLCDF